MTFIAKEMMVTTLIIVLFSAPAISESYPRLDVRDNALDVRRNLLLLERHWPPNRPSTKLRFGQFVVVNTSMSDIPVLHGVNARGDYPPPSYSPMQDFMNCVAASGYLGEVPSGGPNVSVSFVYIFRGRHPQDILDPARFGLPGIVVLPTTLQRGVAKTGEILVCIPSDAPRDRGYYHAGVIVSGYSDTGMTAQDKFGAHLDLSIRKLRPR